MANHLSVKPSHSGPVKPRELTKMLANALRGGQGMLIAFLNL
jgi:hypothetical protein